MTPLTIHCTTCNTRLRVRDESAIGQILACPRCASMVLVERPQAAPTAKDAIEEPSISAMRTPAAARGPDSALSGDIAAAPTQDSESSGGPSVIDPGVASTVSAERTTVESTLLPMADWTSPATQHWRRLLLVGGAAVAGVALAAGVCVLLIYGGTPPPAVTAPRAPEIVKSLPQNRSGDLRSAASAGSETRAERGTPEMVKPLAASSTETPTASAAGAPARPLPADAIVATADDARGNPPAPSRVDSSPPLAAQPAMNPSAPASAPERPSGVKNPPVAAGESHGNAPPSEPAAPGPPSGGQAARLTQPIEDSTRIATVLPSRSLHPPISELPVSGAPPRRAAARIVDVAAGLACKLEEVEFPETALADFVEVLSGLSGIPMTLDLDALAESGLTAATPVQIRQKDATVAGVLAAALGPLELDYVAVAGHVIVTSPAARSQELEQVRYDVADLVQGDAKRLAVLAGLIRELVAPDSWSEAGGRGVLRCEGQLLLIEQSRATQFLVLQLLEKTRVARGLAPASSYPPSFFRLEPRRTRARPVLTMAVSLDFSRPVPWRRILDRLSEAAPVRILVDWHAVSDLGWSAETEAALTAQGQSLAWTLDRLLQPMHLNYRIIDETTLQITTPRKVAERVELEFYPIGDLVSDDRGAVELADRLRDGLGRRALRDEGGGGVLRFDLESRCLLAALPQPQQIALGELLDRQREAKSSSQDRSGDLRSAVSAGSETRAEPDRQWEAK